MIIVSNTSPINYLVLIQQQDILHELFSQVPIPQAVYDELQNEGSPAAVREWLGTHPAWLQVRQSQATDVTLNMLHPGEREAILLAEEGKADALLLDDRQGREAAVKRGLAVIGTLGILDRASERGLVDLPEVLERLMRTNFRVSPEILQSLIENDAPRKRQN